MNERLQTIMGQAATAAVTGLSPSETDIGGELFARPMTPEVREQHEDFIYWHVLAARRHREQMDRARIWDGDYALAFRQRELALSAARRHRQALAIAGFELPQLLTDLLTTEENAP